MEKYQPDFFLSEVRTSQSQLGLILGEFGFVKKYSGRLKWTPVKVLLDTFKVVRYVCMSR